MNPFFRYLLISLVLIAGCDVITRENPDITEKELEDHVNFLASEDLKGRYPGTPGGEQAATYVVDKFSNAGLTLSEDKGKQYFSIETGKKPGKNNHLSIGNIVGKLGKDFVPMPFSGNGRLNAEFVFAGYGFQVRSGNISRDDYKNIDVEEKWVMVLRGAPQNEKLKKLFMGQKSDREKALTAKDNGAAGILFVSPEALDSKDQLVDPRLKKGNIEIPAFHIKRAFADSILQQNTDLTVKDIERRINKTGHSDSFMPGTYIKGESELISQQSVTQNVIAELKIKNPVSPERYIVIGGHYDHLGMGGENTGSRRPDTVAVHYGADDNASGIAAMMEIAEKLVAIKDSLKSHFLFAGFGAEEMGLLGSKYFIKNSPVDPDKISAMINLDMIGRLRDEKSLQIGGTGTSVKAEYILNDLNQSYNFSLGFSPEGYGPSDHSSFYSEDIPVFFFSTGPHLDYHTPEDTPNRLNYSGLKEISEFVYDLAVNLANRDSALSFREAGPKIDTSKARRADLKVTLGIMPDFAGVVDKGLRADVVIKGRPAYRAGMKDGDIITAINGKKIGDIYDYMDRLSEIKPGETITVEVLRDEEKMVLMVQL